MHRRPGSRGLALLCLAFLLALGPEAAWARGGFRGGGFRSAPSFRPSTSYRSFTPSRGWATKPSSTYTKPSLGLKGWGSSTRPLSTAPASTPRLGSGAVAGAGAAGVAAGTSGSPGLSRSTYTARRSVYDTARRSGTLYSTKAEAQAAFSSRYASQYGSTFQSEPASRPTWIPQSTLVGGQSVNVIYNPGLGGYGYLHPTLGTWMLYNAMSDAIMVDTLMNHHNYYYGAPVYMSHGQSWINFALFLLVAIVVLSAVARAVRRARWQ